MAGMRTAAAWDPRVGLFRAPAMAWPHLTTDLDEVRPPLPPPSSFPSPELRPYQDAAVCARPACRNTADLEVAIDHAVGASPLGAEPYAARPNERSTADCA